MQTQVAHNAGPLHYTSTITTGVVICPATGQARADYIKKCLDSQTVSVLLNGGQILNSCMLLAGRCSTEDGFLEMLTIPKVIPPPEGMETLPERDAASGFVEGSPVIVFPINSRISTAAVMPIASGANPDVFRLWGEHQRRDRHVSPNSTLEQMVDGEGGYQFHFKTYEGPEQFNETPESWHAGTTPEEASIHREQRLVSTTRVRVCPDGKVIISMARKAPELASTKNLESVQDKFSILDLLDNDNSPHIVIDPDSVGNGAAPTIHIDSKDVTVDMTPEHMRIARKNGPDEIIMEDSKTKITEHSGSVIELTNGLIKVTASNDGKIELNGGAGGIHSSQNHPTCMFSGAKIPGSPKERTKL